MITSYNNLPIGKYKKLVEIAKRGNLTEDEQNIAIVAILADMTEEEVEAMPYVEMRALCAKAGFIYEQPPTAKPKTRYKIGRFDCEVQTKPEKLTTAQYTDFKQLASVADDKPEVVLSIFLVPRGMKYCDGYDIEELQQAINDHLPIGQGLSILAFFLRRLQLSIESTLIYSASMMKAVVMSARGEKKEMMKAKLEELMGAIRSYGSGDGLTMLPPSLGLPILLGMRSMR